MTQVLINGINLPMEKFDMDKHLIDEIEVKINELEQHPLYFQINNMERLVLFMQRHVFAVFDFMSLAKSLQGEFAPVNKIWTPVKDNDLSRFINEIILCEESDETPDGRVISHFEMYCEAMNEVKADDSVAKNFVNNVTLENLANLIGKYEIPMSSKRFMAYTFDLILNGKIHEIAASFCFGREKAIPKMFQSLIDKMSISKADAPMFHFYLQRHIEVDGGSHGELALRMLDILCGNDEIKWQEAKKAAIDSLNARIKFWDDVIMEIENTESEKVILNSRLTTTSSRFTTV